MKFNLISAIFLVGMTLVSCLPVSQTLPTPTPTSTSTAFSTLTPVPPTITPVPTSTEDPERWMIYEQALAREVLHGVNGICEWDIFGQRDQEVYVWALCQVTNDVSGTAGSVPAVIYLDSSGSIERVQIPGNGTQYGVDIRKLFPKELQELVFQGPMNNDQMWSHVKLRQKNPELPLIVISGVTLP